jgi:hypothetical protein
VRVDEEEKGRKGKRENGGMGEFNKNHVKRGVCFLIEFAFFDIQFCA